MLLQCLDSSPLWWVNAPCSAVGSVRAVAHGESMEMSKEWMFPSQPLKSGLTRLCDWAGLSQAGLATQLCPPALPAKISENFSLFPVSSGMGTVIQMSKFRMFRDNKRIRNGSGDWKWITHLLSLVLWVKGSAGILNVLPNKSFRQWGKKFVGLILRWAIHLKVGLNDPSESLQLRPFCDSVILWFCDSVFIQVDLLCTVWAFSLLSFLLFCLLTVLLTLY